MYRTPLSCCELGREKCLDVSGSFIKMIRGELSHIVWGRGADKMSSKRSAMSVAMVLLCVAVLCVGNARARCKLRKHIHKAMQTDFTGRRCWDDVKIQSCWGYCLSYEISDWRFPYKDSHHLVCGHEDRKHASVKLRNCDPGVEPGTDTYHYIEATSCKCQVCSSEDTSCEWLPPDSSLLGGLVLKEEIEEE